MGERFDTLFSGMSEEVAMATLRSDPAELKNPGEKYLAATRLGACSSAASLERLIEAGGNSSDNLYERITRRKALEALGRRKNPQACSVTQIKRNGFPCDFCLCFETLILPMKGKVTA